MKVYPDTRACVANSEAVSLELDVSSEMGSARLLPRFGDPTTESLSNGRLSLPLYSTPNTVRIEWLASGSSETAPAAFVTTLDVVSRHYFTLDQLKAYGDGRDDFDSLDDDILAMARQAATEVFEQAANRSFVRRIGRTKDYGRPGLLVLEHHDVDEVLTDGYYQASDSQLKRGLACGPFPRWVEYIYGVDHIPAEVSRAVLDLTAYTLRPSNRPIGATGESTDAGYIHFTTAGRDGATSIPEVNAAIQQFGAGDHILW